MGARFGKRRQRVLKSGEALISVIIPCYNAEPFLRETVESVLAQTQRDFEVILIDDGSTDGTADIIRSFGNRVRPVFGPNRGASSARNVGTELARGQFLQYLDADDLLVPDALTKKAEALEGTNADVAYMDWLKLVETDDGSFKNGDEITRTIESVHADPQIALFTDFWCPPAALLYRRSIVERIGGWSTELPVIQDARFLLDAALHGGQFIHVSGIGAVYRVHNSRSLSRNSRKAFVKDCFENALQIEQWWRDHQTLTSERKAALVKVLANLARASFQLDSAMFTRVCAELERVEPEWTPPGPWPLKVLSGIVGYPNAEGVALLYRRFKSILLSR